MNIELDSRSVYDVIKLKGITHFHHANTVATSKSFITKKALLSRSKVEELELEQTPQTSDEIDKKYDVYNFIFLDGLDLAEYFDKPNIYGPVLFKFSIDLLLSPQIQTVRITKTNPCYWNDKLQLNQMYYTSCEELNELYKTGNKYRDGNSCFVITCLDGVLSFSLGLTEILIDDPKLSDKERIPVMELVKDYLFGDIEAFKKEVPNVILRKSERFTRTYHSYTWPDLQKKYKRTFRS